MLYKVRLDCEIQLAWWGLGKETNEEIMINRGEGLTEVK